VFLIRSLNNNHASNRTSNPVRAGKARRRDRAEYLERVVELLRADRECRVRREWLPPA
jgi:hypothetical protein